MLPYEYQDNPQYLAANLPVNKRITLQSKTIFQLISSVIQMPHNQGTPFQASD